MARDVEKRHLLTQPRQLPHPPRLLLRQDSPRDEGGQRRRVRAVSCRCRASERAPPPKRGATSLPAPLALQTRRGASQLTCSLRAPRHTGQCHRDRLPIVSPPRAESSLPPPLCRGRPHGLLLRFGQSPHLAISQACINLSARRHTTLTTKDVMFVVPCALCLVPCALCLVPCALCLVPCALCLVPCALCLVPCVGRWSFVDGRWSLGVRWAVVGRSLVGRSVGRLLGLLVCCCAVVLLCSYAVVLLCCCATVLLVGSSVGLLVGWSVGRWVGGSVGRWSVGPSVRSVGLCCCWSVGGWAVWSLVVGR